MYSEMLHQAVGTEARKPRQICKSICVNDAVCGCMWLYDTSVDVYYVSVLDKLQKSCARTPCVFYHILYR